MIKNKNTRQKLLSLALSGSVLVGNIPAAFALDGYNAVNASGKGQSAITLFVENSKEAILSATVPAELPIKMDLDGNITVPTNAAIVNTTPGKDITVTDVRVDLAEGWKGASYTDDVYFQANDTQVMALRFRGQEMQKDGTIPVQSEQWTIGAGQELPLKMEARLPKQTVAGSKGKVATVSYTLDWAKKDTPPISHVYTLTVLDGEHGTINDKSPIQTDENGVIQSFPNVTPDSGYVFDKWLNAQTGDEIRVGDTLTADVNIQPVYKQADSEVTVEWENGLMIPGSGNRARFSWETADGEDALVKVESDNPAVAVCQRDLMTHTSGGDLVYVEAKSRGVAHITGTMASGKTASFTVNVSELVNSETFESGSLQVEGKATIDGDVVSGDTLNVENLQVTVPVTQADGSTADAPITVTDIPTTPLQAGKNDISVSANVNGVEIVITLHIIAQYAQSETPVSIAVTKQPNKATYIEGENFDPAGMEVAVTYADGHSAIKDSGFTIQDGENLAANKTSVTLSYSENGQTLEIDIPVIIQSVDIDSTIDKTRMDSVLRKLTGKITFSNEEYTGDDGIDISVGQNDSIKVVKNGSNAVVYQEGGVKAPVDSTSLFQYYACSAIDCTNLDTSNVTNMDGMFYNCLNLTSLDLSSFDTSHVTNMSYMFYECNKLASLNVSTFDTSHVTDMSHMFQFKRPDRRYNSSITVEYESPLKLLDVSNFDTNNVTDMSYMFYGCANISSLDLSSFDTSHVTNMANMFYECNKLASLDISSFDTSHVTNMAGMFETTSGSSALVSSLTSLDLSHFNTSNVTNMQNMFSGNTMLTTLNISSFDTSNVTNMAYMFNYCKQLTSLDVSNWDTGKVIDMNSMFYWCLHLSSLDVSNWNTSRVTNMSRMFEDCNVTALDLSNWDTRKVTNIGNMFYNCSSLTSLDVSTWNTKNISSPMDGTFAYCQSLSELDLSSFDIEKSHVQNLKKSVCYGVKGIIYVKNESIKNLLGGGSQIIVRPSSSGETPPESSDIIESNTIDKVRLHEVLSGFAGSVSFSGSKCTDSSAIDISQGQNGSIKVVKGDGKAVIYQEGGVKAPTDSSGLFKGLFDYRWTQCSLNLDNLDTSDVTDMSGMFSGCQYLDYLELSNLDTSNVTDMSGMFQGCNDLEAIDVSNFNTSKVKDMGGMFAGCNDLTSLDVSSFDTSKVTNMGSMFSACQKLTSIDISNFDTSNVTDMNNMFNYCESLVSLDLSSLDTRNVTSMREMFYSCRRLTSLNLSNLDTSNVTDMYGMFEYCSGLTSLDLSNFDTKNVTDITDMFYHCSEINSLDLSSFDTRSIESASSMFAFCYKLRKIDLSSFYFTDKQMRGIATADTNRLVSSFSESATIYVKNEEMKLKLGSYNRENGGKYCTFVIK